MKKIVFGMACLICLSVMGQDRQIEFVERDWKDQLAAAKQEGKLIFFDAYTSWCGPCKVMAKTVFTKNEVADLFNTKFINAKYDMEKGEGVTLKDTYDVSAYPTYLFIDAQGEVVHKIVGSMSDKELIEQANNALNPENTIYGLAKQFEASGRSEASAVAYLDALYKAYESDKRSVVSKLYFDELKRSTLLDEQHWKLASKYLNNPSSKAFAYLYAHRKELEERYDPNIVNRYFQEVFSGSVYRIKKAYNKNQGLKEAKAQSKAIRKLLKQKHDYTKRVLAKLDLIEYMSMRNWDEFAAKMDAICTDTEFPGKNYIVIETANEVVTLNEETQYDNVWRWAGIIEKTKPELFTAIQIAELRKRVLTRQGKKDEAEIMYQKEKALRKEAQDKRLMSPPIMKN